MTTLSYALITLTVLTMIAGLTQMVRAARQRNQSTAYQGLAYQGLGLLLAGAVLSSLNVLTL